MMRKEEEAEKELAESIAILSFEAEAALSVGALDVWREKNEQIRKIQNKEVRNGEARGSRNRTGDR